MKKLLTLLAIICLLGMSKASACTNFLVTKGASVDGSTMISYAADSHVLYGELYHYPAYEIIVEPSTDAPLVTRKLVHALAFVIPRRQIIAINVKNFFILFDLKCL